MVRRIPDAFAPNEPNNLPLLEVVVVMIPTWQGFDTKSEYKSSSRKVPPSLYASWGCGFARVPGMVQTTRNGTLA